MKSILFVFAAIVFLFLALPATAQTDLGSGAGCSAIEGVDASSIMAGYYFTGRIGTSAVSGQNKKGKPTDNSDGDGLTDSMEACINDALMGYCSRLDSHDDNITITPGATEGKKNQRQWFTATFDGTGCGVTECSDRADNDPAAADGTDFPFDPDCADWDDISESEFAETCADQGTCKFVFKTSSAYTGDLKTAGAGATGLDGADNICNAHAQSAGLPGTYTAWLSADGANAKDRVVQAAVPYYLPGPGATIGALVADNFADFLTNEVLVWPGVYLKSAISLDENGAAVSGRTWTDTRENGVHWGPSADCSEWTTDSADPYCANTPFPASGGVGCGRIGKTTTSAEWTNGQIAACSSSFTLYCLQD